MHASHLPLPSPLAYWSTASASQPAANAASEQMALGEHLRLCRHLAGGQNSLQWGALVVHGFLAARFVTTLLLVSLAFGLAAAMAS